MARISDSDWRNWTAEAASMLLRRVAETDWQQWRKPRRISAENLATIQAAATERISQSVKLDLNLEFERARQSLEETKTRMDRVFEVATEGIPVCADDPEAYKAAIEDAQRVITGLSQAVAACKVRLEADKALNGLLGLVAPASDPDSQSDGELEQAVKLHLMPLQLTADEAPASEHVRLAASKILELLGARPPVLGIVG